VLSSHSHLLFLCIFYRNDTIDVHDAQTFFEMIYSFYFFAPGEQRLNWDPFHFFPCACILSESKRLHNNLISLRLAAALTGLQLRSFPDVVATNLSILFFPINFVQIVMIIPQPSADSQIMVLQFISSLKQNKIAVVATRLPSAIVVLDI